MKIYKIKFKGSIISQELLTWSQALSTLRWYCACGFNQACLEIIDITQEE